MSRAPVDIPGLEGPPLSRPARRRHALGLPAGSVRALLASLVFGLLAAIIIVDGRDRVPTLYTYLWYLLLLIIAHYFAAHGNTIRTSADERSPLGLPSGFFRFVFVAGFVGLIAWLYHENQNFQPPNLSSAANPLILLAGFFAGVCIARLVRWTHGEKGPPFWFQDLEAWIALLAVIVLVVQVVVLVFVRPSLSPEQQELMEGGRLEGVFPALVGLYFGLRS
jgi:hypothetical protein